MAKFNSAVAPPQLSFEGRELYPKLVEKAAAIAFWLIWNYPFVDGNRRVGYTATEVSPLLNGFEIEATQE